MQINAVPRRDVDLPKSGPRYGTKPSARSGYNDRHFFFAQLAALLRTGISPAEALATILARSSAGTFRREVEEMARMCAEGMSLAEAMEHYPKMFPKGVVGAVRAGEVGGYLPDACDTVSKQQRETRTIFLFFLALMIVVPLFVGGVLFAITVAGGINRGIDAVRDGNSEPAVELGMQEMFGSVVGPVLIAILVLTVLGIVFALSVKFRRVRHRIGLALPPFRWRAYNENLAHFSYHLGQLSRAGLSPFTSWRIAAQAVPNEVYADRLVSMAHNMNERTKLSELMYRSRIFPRETAQVVETGEVTGDMPTAMEHVMDIGRQKEKLGVAYIGAKAGCWAILLFTVGGMVMFIIVYGTYIRGVFRVME
jgi:type II secretory pathway component PulF